MYINFKILTKNNISARQLLCLLAVKQKDFYLFEKNVKPLRELLELGYLVTVKSFKEEYSAYRLSEKGKKFLSLISIAEITKDSEDLAEALIGIYDRNQISLGGSKQKVHQMVAWFKAETSFENEEIIQAVDSYIAEIDDKKFIPLLCNFIWKGANHYSSKWSLSESRLYSLLEKPC